MAIDTRILLLNDERRQIMEKITILYEKLIDNENRMVDLEHECRDS